MLDQMRLSRALGSSLVLAVLSAGASTACSGESTRAIEEKAAKIIQPRIWISSTEINLQNFERKRRIAEEQRGNKLEKDARKAGARQQQQPLRKAPLAKVRPAEVRDVSVLSHPRPRQHKLIRRALDPQSDILFVPPPYYIPQAPAEAQSDSGESTGDSQESWIAVGSNHGPRQRIPAVMARTAEAQGPARTYI